MSLTQNRNRVVVIQGTTAAGGTPRHPATAQPPRAARRIVIIRNGAFVGSRPNR